MAASGHNLSQLELLPDDLLVKIAQCMRGVDSAKSVFNLYTCCSSTHTRAVQACISSTLALDFSDPAGALSRLKRFPPACTLENLNIRHFSTSVIDSLTSLPFLTAIQALPALKSRLAYIKSIHLSAESHLEIKHGVAEALKPLLMELCPGLETFRLNQKGSHWDLLRVLGDPCIGPGPLQLKELQIHVQPFHPPPLFSSQPGTAAQVLAAFRDLVSLKFGVPQEADIAPLAQLRHLRMLQLTYRGGEEMLGLHTVLAHAPLRSLSVCGSAYLGNQQLSSQTLRVLAFGSIEDNDTFFRLVTTSHLPQLQCATVDALRLDLLELDESQLLSLLEHRPRFVFCVVRLELLCYDEELLPGLLAILGPHVAHVLSLKLNEPCYESVSALGDLLELMPWLANFESEGGSVDSDCLAASISELAHMPHLFFIKLCNLTRPLPPFLPPSFIVENTSVRDLSLSGFHFERGSIAGLASCFRRLWYLNLTDFSHRGGSAQCKREARCFPSIMGVNMSKAWE